MPLLSMSTYNLNSNIYLSFYWFSSLFSPQDLLFFSILSICRGFLTPKIRKCTHNPPVRARYGMSFEFFSSDYSWLSFLCVLFDVVLYMTAIYRKCTVFTSTIYMFRIFVLIILACILYPLYSRVWNFVLKSIFTQKPRVRMAYCISEITCDKTLTCDDS